MKAGYQGRKDSMRNLAERLMNHPGHAEAVYFSKSAADKEKMRPYKSGGHVKNRESMERERQLEHHRRMEREEKMEKHRKEHMAHKDKEKKSHKKEHLKKDCQKFAMGGVAKIRHDEATADGMPKNFKKKSVKDLM